MSIKEDIEEWKEQINWGLKERPLGGDIVRHTIAIPVGNSAQSDLSITQSELKTYYEQLGYDVTFKDEGPEEFSLVLSKKTA
ncbi:hypothetical protein M9194_07030 [Vibrio sp. S4M6]|uniref:hypothetical protein n=1 Tax=Vibrio sinus TaxID=2946865 RepID=UPI00202A6D10|nr:hypothetical protein [Vibrio sinus]MCL9781179.1 hypothetical protein [Vibrio sinus]